MTALLSTLTVASVMVGAAFAMGYMAGRDSRGRSLAATLTRPPSCPPRAVPDRARLRVIHGRAAQVYDWSAGDEFS